VHLLVPYWGDPALLDATITSVLAQDDPDWTVTIVDDCYPDPAARERWEHHPDARITYLRNDTNLGVAGNFERCRRLAVAMPAGRCTFLGSDDLLDASYVRRVRELDAERPDVAMIQCSVRVIGADGLPSRGLAEQVKARLTPDVGSPTVLQGEDLAASLLTGNWLYWPAIAFRTEALERVSFRDDLPIILDLALILDLVLAGEGILLDPVVSFSYRRHDASASSESRFDRRFTDEARFHAEVADRLRALGWRRARRAARLRATSRLHAVALLPGAVRERSWDHLRTLLQHAVGA
jgi:hypothetical protein